MSHQVLGSIEDQLDDIEVDESLAVLVPPWVARSIYVAAAIILIALLILHTSKWHRVQVDTTTALLLALLILVPLVPYLTKFKAAGVEAEFDRRQFDRGLRRLKKTAEDVPLPEDVPQPVAEAADDVMSLIRRDPTLGLAKLRIELEDVLRRRYLRLIGSFEPERLRRTASAGQMLRALEQHREINPFLVPSLREVIALANRAIHGTKVSRRDAEELAEVGVQLLEILESDEQATGSGPSQAEP
jgi:hypothetical protein